jgi:hypothetical protein
MAIRGVISSRDVLRNGSTILREFGARAYFRCCVAMLLRRPSTFLDCIFA